MMERSDLDWADYATLGVYFVVVVIVGIWDVSTTTAAAYSTHTFINADDTIINADTPQELQSALYALSFWELKFRECGDRLIPTWAKRKWSLARDWRDITNTGFLHSDLWDTLCASTFRPNRGTSAGYFLAGRSMTWIPIGCSIFASNVGAPMFIGLAGTAAASGFAVTIYEWHAIYLLMALGWLFLPVYISAGVFTVPEYLKRRYGGRRIRLALLVLVMLGAALLRIPIEIYSGALLMQQIIGWNLYVSVTVILAFTALYTLVGGLAAVMYTDTLQTVILLLGSGTLTIIGIVKVGGWDNMMRKYMTAAANYTLAEPQNYSCGMPRNDSFHLWRDPVNSDMPWPGAVIGATIMGMWVWCADQVTVQRCLSAKDMTHAKAGSLLGGFLKLLSFLLFVVPGMISRTLYPDVVACADPDTCTEICGNPAGCTDFAFPLLVVGILPRGLKGAMLAALLAAVMSSLTSVFNSTSTMFTLDLWPRFRPRARERELMVVGRVMVIILTGMAILWIPILQATQGGQLWQYMQGVLAGLLPPWTVMLLLGVFWTRTTEMGAFWGLIGGIVIGMVRIVLNFVYPAPLCGSFEEDTRPRILSRVHFLNFAIILAFLTFVLTVGISLVTQTRAPEKLRRVTWWTRHEENPEMSESDGSDEEDDVTSVACNTPQAKKKKTVPRVVYNWLCGISETPQHKLTKQEKAVIKMKMTDIKETPRMKKILDVCAIAVAAAVAFMLGFFA